MFDMFDNSNRGWLIKLIEEVEEEEVVVGAAIVESEFVEIVLGSDTMKKIWLRLNWSKYKCKNKKKEPENRKGDIRTKERERTMKRISEFSVMICLMILIACFSIYT